MIILYSKNDCTACVAVKNFLANNGVKVEERNIDSKEEYLDEVKELGYVSVPITITQDKEEIVGFDLPKLQKLI